MSQELYNNELKEFKQKLCFGIVSDVANDFLYSINNVYDFQKETLNSLNILPDKMKQSLKIYQNNSSNIVQFQAPYQFFQIIKELKRNIVLKNHWSIFYLNFTLSERYADYLISLNSKFLTNNSKNIKDNLEGKNGSHKMDFDYKIKKLNHIKNQHKSKYIHKLVTLLYLFQEIRNTFMFHFKDIDLYSFVYDGQDIHEKEKLLTKELEGIHKKINEAMKQFKDNPMIMIILRCSEQRITDTIDYIGKNQSSDKSFLITDMIYEDLIMMFSRISCTIIFFVDMEKPYH